MSTLLTIHLVISAVTFVYTLALSGMIRKKLGITRVPFVTFKTFKVIVTCLFPVVNLLALLGFMFAEKQIIDSLIEEMMEEQEKGEE